MGNTGDYALRRVPQMELKKGVFNFLISRISQGGWSVAGSKDKRRGFQVCLIKIKKN
jgi:hypothetical protein